MTASLLLRPAAGFTVSEEDVFLLQPISSQTEQKRVEGGFGSRSGRRRGDSAEQDVLQGHVSGDVAAQFGVESSGLQVVKSAAVDQLFAETTHLLPLGRRQEAAEET